MRRGNPQALFHRTDEGLKQVEYLDTRLGYLISPVIVDHGQEHHRPQTVFSLDVQTPIDKIRGFFRIIDKSKCFYLEIYRRELTQ